MKKEGSAYYASVGGAPEAYSSQFVFVCVYVCATLQLGCLKIATN